MRAVPLRRDSLLVWLLLAVGGPLLLFALLAYGVRNGATFSWDRELVGYFDAHYDELRQLRRVTKALVYAGMAAGAVLALLVVTALVGLQRRRQALFWALAVPGAVVVATVLKAVFQRREIGDPEGEYSFPSGNATASLAVVLAAGLLVSRSPRRWVVALAGVALVSLYGLALVLLLWHYPSDVVAGWCLALAWVSGLWLGLGAASDHDAVGVENWRTGCNEGAGDVNRR